MIVKAQSLVSSRMRPTLIVVGLVAGGPLFAAAQTPATSERAFERLKTLVGTWEVAEKGTSRKMIATYVMTGRGSALLEEFGSPAGAVGGMSTAYHLDKGALVLTHFCGAGNQPRMRIKTIENDGRHLLFEMYDITNLADPKAYHSTALEVSFLEDGTVELAYRGMTAGRDSTQTFQLLRRTSAAASR